MCTTLEKPAAPPAKDTVAGFYTLRSGFLVPEIYMSLGGRASPWSGSHESNLTGTRSNHCTVDIEDDRCSCDSLMSSDASTLYRNFPNMIPV